MAANSTSSTPSTTKIELWRQIADSIRSEIETGHLQPGDRLPTGEELGQRWSVSRITVQHAMDELQREGLISRRRGSGSIVSERSASDSGAALPQAASRPAAGLADVAAVFTGLGAQWQLEYLRGASTVTREPAESGHALVRHLIYCDTANDIHREADTLRSMRRLVGAILLLPTCAPENTPLLDELTRSGFPLICVDRVPADAGPLDAVLADNYDVTRRALRHLTARGHRRIAHFTQDTPNLSSVGQRLAAYEAHCAEIEQSPAALMRCFPANLLFHSPMAVQLASDALFALLHEKQPPTALFCLHDGLLSAVLAACEQLQLRVPEDLEILSFNDGLTLLPSTQAQLHLIRQNAFEAGRLAIAQILSRLGGDASPPHQQIVPAEFLPAQF